MLALYEKINQSFIAPATKAKELEVLGIFIDANFHTALNGLKPGNEPVNLQSMADDFQDFWLKYRKSNALRLAPQHFCFSWFQSLLGKEQDPFAYVSPASFR